MTTDKPCRENITRSYFTEKVSPHQLTWFCSIEKHIGQKDAAETSQRVHSSKTVRTSTKETPDLAEEPNSSQAPKTVVR